MDDAYGMIIGRPRLRSKALLKRILLERKGLVLLKPETLPPPRLMQARL